MIALALALLVALAVPVGVAGIDAVYTDAVLRYWAQITPEDIGSIRDREIRRVLTPEERARLDPVVLRFPLRCPLPDTEPFCFYAHRLDDGTPAITFSVASLRLFGDLALAQAWLQLTGHAIDTPINYLSMAKHRDPGEFPGGRYPPPLETLGIPDAARNDAAVMDLYGKLHTSAMVFVLLHELGHHLHRHPGYGPGVSRAQTRANEARADEFALDVMARLGYPPLGTVNLYMLMAHWAPNRWDFPDETAYAAHLATATHPLTSDRLRALAGALERAAPEFARMEPDYTGALVRLQGVAGDIAGLGSFLDDPDIQQGIALTGAATTPAALKPRRQGELPLDAEAPEGEAPFHGEFIGEISDASGSLPTVLVLRRRGERVTGEYSYGIGVGRIDGEVLGGQLHFGWELGADWGSGILESSADGHRLQGAWGYGTSAENGGRWVNRRR